MWPKATNVLEELIGGGGGGGGGGQWYVCAPHF